MFPFMKKMINRSSEVIPRANFERIFLQHLTSSNGASGSTISTCLFLRRKAELKKNGEKWFILQTKLNTTKMFTSLPWDTSRDGSCPIWEEFKMKSIWMNLLLPRKMTWTPRSPMIERKVPFQTWMWVFGSVNCNNLQISWMLAILHENSDSKKIRTTQAFVQSENWQTVLTKPFENATTKVQSFMKRSKDLEMKCIISFASFEFW